MKRLIAAAALAFALNASAQTIVGGAGGGGGGGDLSATSIDTSAELKAILTDEVGFATGKLLFVASIADCPSSYVTYTASTGALACGTFGTGIATALAINTGSAGAPVLLNGAGGTPSSMTGTNITGLPLSTGVTGDLPFANLTQCGTDTVLANTTAGTADVACVGYSTLLADQGVVSFTDPNADKLIYWRDSDGTWQPVTIGTGLSLTTGTLAATSSSLPVADTTSIVEGSADGTKEVRIEADGITTGTIRVWTAPDADTTIPVISQVLTISGPTAGRTITVPDAAFTVVGLDSTQTLTNKTYDVEGTGNVFTSVSKVWLSAAGCNNATASSFWDLPTSNAGAAACVTGTNTQKGVLDFDAATSESAQTTLALPADFTGTVDARIKWFAAATSGDVIWNVATICVADAETDDPAFNTASAVTDTAKGTTNQTNDASITGVTITGCAAGELMHVKISRDAAAGGDTMTGDARLVGLELSIRRAQ